ncbi:MAG: tail fiber protein [Oscillibacter sp.]|nr:tail fiber protein [Oscillibacter sp.]MCI9002362.1 tail fiber protein [Oscillibacter sp.]
MFELYAEKNKLRPCRWEHVTSGSVDVYPVRFTFSEHWEGLTRTAVFRAAEARVSVLLGPEGTCNVPWEVLQKPGCVLEAGVYGTDDAGEMVLPTVWVNLGTILEGVTPGEVIPPTPELWEQALARKGDALGYTEDGRLGLYSGEELLSSVPVSGGGDGIPIGAVISFLGLMAPAGYLICDGAVKDIREYPALADLFRRQFGAVNHFGGDGETTFALPDMRNLFLRGYHGEAEERLSGDVGAKQDATMHPGIYGGTSSQNVGSAVAVIMKTPSTYSEPLKCDSAIKSTRWIISSVKETGFWDGHEGVFQYTSRPVNMAVLYCIKAI